MDKFYGAVENTFVDNLLLSKTNIVAWFGRRCRRLYG